MTERSMAYFGVLFHIKGADTFGVLFHAKVQTLVVFCAFHAKL